MEICIWTFLTENAFLAKPKILQENLNGLKTITKNSFFNEENPHLSSAPRN